MSAQPTTTVTKKGGKSFSDVFSSFAIPVLLVLGISIYIFVLGNPSNFEGGVPTNHPIKEGIGHVLGLMHKGGFIVPILVSLVLMTVSFSVERFLTIGKAQGKGSAKDLVAKIKTFLNQGQIDAAIAECDKQEGSVANVTRATLVKYKEMLTVSDLTKDQKVLALQKELEEATQLELPHLERNLVIIATMASVSTLIALLGTVIGMIKAFSALAAEGAGGQGALADGISEALINTALGIGNSALATIMYNVFTSKIDGITHTIDEIGFTITQQFAASQK
ncbi:MAG: MotA/TolQ/ExbB proton channel family protein [Bacteroidia bacterium]|nr:MotA/TolQ/ExbB proton channel family protein [Bacteroidia bacterium]